MVVIVDKTKELVKPRDKIFPDIIAKIHSVDMVARSHSQYVIQDARTIRADVKVFNYGINNELHLKHVQIILSLLDCKSFSQKITQSSSEIPIMNQQRTAPSNLECLEKNAHYLLHVLTSDLR